VLLESTGVIGRQLKMEALLQGVPQLAGSLEAGADAAQHAAVAITTTDLVSKSAALEASEIQIQRSGSAWLDASRSNTSCMLHFVRIKNNA
jgi:N-acetylglutamate synthase/N-acetylornithine aminotransferase